jgi:hypothetical protein
MALFNKAIDFLSIPLASSHFLSSKAHCSCSSRTFANSLCKVSKSFRIRFGNFAKNSAKALTSLAWIAQKINIIL